MPFGGVGASGYGRYHGETGFRQFSNGKSVLEKGVANYYPFTAAMPPLTEKKEKELMELMKKPVLTMGQIKKGLTGLVLFIIIITLLIIFRSDIMDMIGSSSS